MLRKTSALACSIAVTATLVAASGAKAAWPGQEGRIALMVDTQDLSGPFESRIVTVEPDGSDPIVVHSCSAHGSDEPCVSPEQGAVAWSPDGLRLAVVVEGRIATVNADGSGWQVITRGDSWDREPAWSPDGRRIAFVRLAGRSGPAGVPPRVVSARADGSDLQQVTRHGLPTDVAWSSRGQIAWIDLALDRIIKTDSRGRHQRVLAKGGKVYGLDWSPDGQRLLFSRAAHRQGLWSVARTGRGARREAAHLHGSVWSPTGRRVATAESDAFVLSRVDGSRPKVVLPSVPRKWGYVRMQAWGPRSR